MLAGKKAVDVGEDVVWFDEQLCAAATVELGWPDDWRETFANDEVVVLCEVLMPGDLRLMSLHRRSPFCGCLQLRGSISKLNQK